MPLIGKTCSQNSNDNYYCNWSKQMIETNSTTFDMLNNIDFKISTHDFLSLD